VLKIDRECWRVVESHGNGGKWWKMVENVGKCWKFMKIMKIDNFFLNGKNCWRMVESHKNGENFFLFFYNLYIRRKKIDALWLKFFLVFRRP
jgi:hypothetical protein